MKHYAVKEVVPILYNQKYGYVALLDQQGGFLIPFNSNRTHGDKRIAEIESRLQNIGMKEGFYTIKAKNSLAKNTVADEFIVLKGKPPTISENTPIEIVKTVSPDVLTYDNALKLSIECERLKLENEALKKEVLNLEKQIQDLEEDADTLAEENPQGSLMENAQSFLTNAMGFIAPLLDQHFELKKQALGLRAVELQMKMDGKPKPAPEQRDTQQQQKQNYIQAFIMTYKDHEEIYTALAELYNTAANEDEFLNRLKDYNEDFYNACKNGK